jgi:death-on-curing protein
MHLEADDVVEIHDRLIALHRGQSGIRSRGMIDFAVAAASRKKDPTFEAAAILEFIAKNRPFTDGNGGTAFASAAAELRLGGYGVVAPDDEVVGFMSEVAANRLTFTHIAAWLKDRLAKQDDPTEPEEDKKRRVISETLEAHMALLKKLSGL